MRRYADLHVYRETFNTDAPRVAATLKRLDFDYVGITLHAGHDPTILSAQKKLLEAHGLDLVSRVDLQPRTRAELLGLLRRLRRRFELVAVHCLSNETALTASRDKRVDLVYFTPSDMRIRFRTGVAHICNCALEINVNDVVRAQHPLHSILNRLTGEVAVASANKIPIIISSGARTHLQVKAPRDMASLATLLGAKPEESLNMVSGHATALVTGNRRKLQEHVMLESGEVAEKG